jgi:hypothetical protein
MSFAWFDRYPALMVLVVHMDAGNFFASDAPVGNWGSADEACRTAGYLSDGSDGHGAAPIDPSDETPNGIAPVTPIGPHGPVGPVGPRKGG